MFLQYFVKHLVQIRDRVVITCKQYNTGKKKSQMMNGTNCNQHISPFSYGASNTFVHTKCKNHSFPLRRKWVVSCLLGLPPQALSNINVLGNAALQTAATRFFQNP